MTVTPRPNNKRVQKATVLEPSVFDPYVKHLSSLLSATFRHGPIEKQAELALALDGQPGRELRKLYATDRLRDTGTYFTGSSLATRLVAPLTTLLPEAVQVTDPACGAGDLLVACARHLAVRTDPVDTLQEWGRLLSGFDINPAFVQTTKYRLALLAYERCGCSGPQPTPLFDELFPQVRLGSGLSDWSLPSGPSVIVVNPPFSYGVAAPDCTWADGRVSQAALFMDTCLHNAPDGARILAILPDVLRTGTRYEKWRRMIATKARINSVEIVGQFDELTEINVFLLSLTAGTADADPSDWARPRSTTNRTVKDLFAVHVGPVVPFRLTKKGPWCAYVHSEQLPPWSTVRNASQRLRFSGTTYNPPFVAIRRTSKADYQVRCIGTLVTGTRPIAVENHLLIALPKDKKVGTCKRLLDLLKDDATSTWMNERIRCRHLTVGSVGDLPWPEDK